MIRSLAALEALYWVVRLGGFQAAAARLNVAQPTISHRIRELERRTGRQMLQREGHRVQPTAYGAATFEYAGRIIALTQDLEGRLRAGGPVRGVLRLGGSDGFAMVCLGECLNALKPSHPDLRVAVTVGNSRMLEQKLQEGELDLAILSDAHATRELRTRVLGQQEIAWVGGPSLDLAPEPAPVDLLKQQIFTNPAPSHLFTVLMDWFGASGVPPPPLSSCDSVAVIANLIAAGAGISILPVCIVHKQLAAGTLRRIDVAPAPPRQRIVAAWSRRSDLTGLEAIVDIIGQTAATTQFLT